MSGEPVLDKVRKLLAKAEATDNAHEADAFAAKAAALIAHHRIDVARVAGGDDELAVRDVPIGRGAYVRARLALLDAVARANDCEVVWRSGPEGAVAMVAGHTSDLDATTMLYASLHVQAAAHLGPVRRATPAATQRWRRAFLFGYAARVGELLAASRRRVEDESAAAGSLLPDVPARAARVHEFADTAFGRVVAARPPRAVTPSGWSSGQRAATAADIGRARLAGRPALGRGGAA